MTLRHAAGAVIAATPFLIIIGVAMVSDPLVTAAVLFPFFAMGCFAVGLSLFLGDR